MKYPFQKNIPNFVHWVLTFSYKHKHAPTRCMIRKIIEQLILHRQEVLNKPRRYNWEKHSWRIDFVKANLYSHWIAENTESLINGVLPYLSTIETNNFLLRDGIFIDKYPWNLAMWLCTDIIWRTSRDVSILQEEEAECIHIFNQTEEKNKQI